MGLRKPDPAFEYPDWIWWSSFAIGQDCDALRRCINHARGERFADRFIQEIGVAQ